MEKTCLLICFYLLVSVVASASPYPEPGPTGYQAYLPEPIEPEFPPQPAETFVVPAPVPGAQVAPDIFNHLSGVLFYGHLIDWGGLSINPQSLPEQMIPNTAQISPALSISSSYNMTSDSNQDIEPSVMAHNSNGTVYKSTTYIKILSDGVTPRIYYSTTPDFYTFQRGQLALPSGYQYTADPLMSKNAFNGGIAPGRIYTTGLIYNPGSGQSYGIPNGIAVWSSNDGGRSWLQATIIISDTSDRTSTFDKPAVDVSWNSGSLGYVYAAYIYVYGGTNPATTYIGVSRSTDGGVTFPQTTVPFSTSDKINGVQVLVDYYSGYVYVLWTDFSNNTIYMSTSRDMGTTWSAPESVASGKMVNPNYFGYQEYGFLKCSGSNNGVRAASVTMARFNWAANKISVVWHEWKQGSPSNCNSLPPGSSGCTTEVYYAAKSPSGWQGKVKISDALTNDQFMPALDFDSTGNLTVTFYDRRDDANNIKYYPYIARIDSTGRLRQANMRASTFQSDPTKYTQYPCFIGDYHDIWDQTISNVDNYFSAWVGIPASIGDIYLSTIVP
ncbi:MAG: sialidase family protein [Nitrospiraceae bacterium]|nr:sialidase family protein [Nitrospiraceae bacterium]